MYTPKDTPINCKKIDVKVNIIPLNKNNFNLLKKTTYSYILGIDGFNSNEINLLY